MLQRSLLAAAVVAGLTVSSAALAQNIVINSFTGPNHFQTEAMRIWKADVERVTEGRVTVEILPASAAPPPRQIDGALAGQYDAAFMFNGFNANRADWPSGFLLPFSVTNNGEASSVALWRTYEKFFRDKGDGQFGDDGIHVLSVFVYPGGVAHSGTSQPIESVADLRSRKMWALVGTPSALLTALDIDHVAGPAARVAEFVQTNVVEVLFVISFDANVAFGAKEFTQSSTVFPKPVQAANFIFFITNDKWAEISPQDQALIESVSGEVYARNTGRLGNEREVKARQEHADKGTQIIEASQAFIDELTVAGAPLREAWNQKAAAMGIDPQEPLDFFAAEAAKIEGGSN